MHRREMWLLICGLCIAAAGIVWGQQMIPEMARGQQARTTDIAALVQQLGRDEYDGGIVWSVGTLDEIRHYGKKAIPYLLDAVDDPNLNVRAWSVTLLGSPLEPSEEGMILPRFGGQLGQAASTRSYCSGER